MKQKDEQLKDRTGLLMSTKKSLEQTQAEFERTAKQLVDTQEQILQEKKEGSGRVRVTTSGGGTVSKTTFDAMADEVTAANDDSRKEREKNRDLQRQLSDMGDQLSNREIRIEELNAQTRTHTRRVKDLEETVRDLTGKRDYLETVARTAQSKVMQLESSNKVLFVFHRTNMLPTSEA